MSKLISNTPVYLYSLTFELANLVSIKTSPPGGTLPWKNESFFRYFMQFLWKIKSLLLDDQQ